MARDVRMPRCDAAGIWPSMRERAGVTSSSSLDADLRDAEAQLARPAAATTADPQAETAAQLVNWATFGLTKLVADDIRMARVACCAMYRRTSSGSLPGGANTHRPSASSTATAPGGIGRISCRTAAAIAPLLLLLPRSSAIRTAASVVGSPLPKPSWTRQRKIMLVAMLCRRQTAAALTPGCS